MGGWGEGEGGGWEGGGREGGGRVATSSTHRGRRQRRRPAASHALSPPRHGAGSYRGSPPRASSPEVQGRRGAGMQRCRGGVSASRRGGRAQGWRGSAPAQAGRACYRECPTRAQTARAHPPARRRHRASSAAPSLSAWLRANLSSAAWRRNAPAWGQGRWAGRSVGARLNPRCRVACGRLKPRARRQGRGFVRSVAHVIRQGVRIVLLFLLGRVPYVLARAIDHLEPHHRARFGR